MPGTPQPGTERSGTPRPGDVLQMWNSVSGLSNMSPLKPGKGPLALDICSAVGLLCLSLTPQHEPFQAWHGLFRREMDPKCAGLSKTWYRFARGIISTLRSGKDLPRSGTVNLQSYIDRVGSCRCGLLQEWHGSCKAHRNLISPTCAFSGNWGVPR